MQPDMPMKTCPMCQSVYPADDDYCPNDGSALVPQPQKSHSSVVISWDDKPAAGEIPTQYVPVPDTPTITHTDNSKWLYGVIGGLVAVILMGGGYLLLVGSQGKDIENASVENSAPAANLSSDNTEAGAAVNTDVNAKNSPGNSASKPVNAPTNAETVPPFIMANTANTAADSRRQTAPLARRFQRTFYGTVDNDGIEMYLERNGSSLAGKVNPRGRYADIYVEGYIENDGSFLMDEKSDIGVVTGVYRGRINSDGTIIGTWSKPGGEKTRPLYLRRR